MNQDEIISMAREVGIDWHKHWDYDETNRIGRFAALVAAAEREACAKLMDNMAKQDKHSNYYKVAAAAIRARGAA